MAEANPYELGGRRPGGPDPPVKAATYTAAEQREKLAGYICIPNTFWPTVKYATHVRYIESAARGGEFRAGGFVLKNPFDTKVKGTAVEKRFLKLQNGFQKTAHDYKEWIVAYEDIEYLYAKADAVDLTLHHDLQTAVATLSQNIKQLAEFAKKLEVRVKALEGRP